MLFHPFSKGQYFEPEQTNIADWKPSQRDWEKANDSLKGKPSGTKFDKWLDKQTTQKRADFSFMMIESEIYALSNKEVFKIISGNFGNVKQGQTVDGKLRAIKIENPGLSIETPEAVQIGKKVGLILSRAQRDDAGMQFRGKTVPHKRYTVMPWGGRELFEYYADESLDSTQTHLVSLKSCLILQSLHENNILHCDIKPENIILTINPSNPYDIDVKFIDYDFSMELPPGVESILGKVLKGTIESLAPEIVQKLQYSKASDIYALVVGFLADDLLPNKISYDVIAAYMDYVENGYYTPFLKHLDAHRVKLTPPAFEQMIKGFLAINPAERLPLDVLIHYLCSHLENDPKLDMNTKSKIQEIKLISSKNGILPPIPAWYAPALSYAKTWLPAWLSTSHKRPRDEEDSTKLDEQASKKPRIEDS